MTWTTYKEKIKQISQRIVEAQRPIRILDAIKWDPSIEQALIESKFREIPKVDADYYSKIELGYDPQEKITEFRELEQDIVTTLGKDDELGLLLKTIVQEYALVIEMILNRGTKKFWECSKILYGSPKDFFFEDTNRIIDLGQLLYSILSRIDDTALGSRFDEDVEAEEVVNILNERFRDYFIDDPVRAKLSEGIVADASAGSDVVRIKEGSKFSIRDVDILEVHEGWVHVGTTQNGSAQHIAKWLSKGPPRCSATQEGLAV
ncbi:MAG: DUF1704 domain-containing protein, partial [Deltaproteobacteria bacterium]|nr:DUF1704 domain-containing protein [Deltaproteobacteria bacterium]